MNLLLFITLMWDAPIDANGFAIPVEQYTLYAGVEPGHYVAAFPIIGSARTSQRVLINHPVTYFVVTDTLDGVESAPSNEVSYP